MDDMVSGRFIQQNNAGLQQNTGMGQDDDVPLHPTTDFKEIKKGLSKQDLALTAEEPAQMYPNDDAASLMLTPSMDRGKNKSK